MIVPEAKTLQEPVTPDKPDIPKIEIGIDDIIIAMRAQMRNGSYASGPRVGCIEHMVATEIAFHAVSECVRRVRNKDATATVCHQQNIPTDTAIMVWNYESTPVEIKTWLRYHAIDTSDLDWIALLPRIYIDQYVPWLESPSFGCSRIMTYNYSEENQLILGYHS